MNFQESDYDNLVSLFWNNDKGFSDEQHEVSSSNPKYIGLSKFFENDPTNNTKTTCHTLQNFTINSHNLNNSNANPCSDLSKKQKVFMIKKYVKYEEIIKEFCGDEEQSDNEKKVKKPKIPKEKRIKLIKYNNKKLSNLEKVEKLKILSKVVRRYRRKIKNIKKKIKQNSEKIFSRYLGKKLIKSKKNPRLSQNSLSLKNLILALKKLRNNNLLMEFPEDCKALENLISLIASGKLKPESTQFQNICSQVRYIINDQKMKLTSKSNNMIQLSEQKFYVSSSSEQELNRRLGDEANFSRMKKRLRYTDSILPGICLPQHSQEVKNQGIFDPILESVINKSLVNSEEFYNNLLNTDITTCNNVFIK